MLPRIYIARSGLRTGLLNIFFTMLKSLWIGALAQALSRGVIQIIMIT
jgi:hypothetical protein